MSGDCCSGIFLGVFFRKHQGPLETWFTPAVGKEADNGEACSTSTGGESKGSVESVTSEDAAASAWPYEVALRATVIHALAASA